MNAPARSDPGPDTARTGRPHYAERLRVPVWWWFFAAGMTGSLWFAAWYAIPTWVGHLVGAVATVLSWIGLWAYGRLQVRVDDQALSVGGTRLPVSSVGSVLVLSPAQARALRGTAADATARMFLRPYLDRGLRVEVTDPDDPAPYWYVATRHPERLAGALTQAAGTAAPRH